MRDCTVLYNFPCLYQNTFDIHFVGRDAAAWISADEPSRLDLTGLLVSLAGPQAFRRSCQASLWP